MRYETRHRAAPGTVRHLRRTALSTTLAAMALTAATGGSAAYAFTGAATWAAAPLGPLSAEPSSIPIVPSWEDPVVIAPSRETDDGSRPGGRTAADLIEDIPVAALGAYQQSAAVLHEASPRCRLHWSLLAAVGRVLTDHGQRGDHRVDNEGNVRPRIVGKPLLARGGIRVGDTDIGLLDEDRRFDRPVGPMLLTPADWSVVAVDGDTDGLRNPHDLHDASLALAVLLCARGEDLRTTPAARAVLRRVDNTPGFPSEVLEVNAAYHRQLRSGTEPVHVEPPTTTPTLPTPPMAQPTDRTTQSDRPPADPDTGPVKENQPRDEPDHGHVPAPNPQPEPQPEPEPTSTEAFATYDPAALQIRATAVVNAGGAAAPTGAVTFTLSGPNGVNVTEVPLTGGSAIAQFEVTAPGAYTIAASYAGTKTHTASADTLVVQVTLPPTEPTTEAIH